MIDVREYNDRDGRSPFADWFNRLNAYAAAKVTTALTRLGQGNVSNVKGIGSGVFECRIDFRPRLPRVFRERRGTLGDLARRGQQETPATGYQHRPYQMAGLQAEKIGGQPWR
jgi:putative component of toxin-antitoxin plasmid stabilization module